MSGRILYLNCTSGVSGDMIAGALIHLGASFDLIREAVDSLGVGPITLRIDDVRKGHLSAISFMVDVPKEARSLPTLAEVRRTVEGSTLPAGVIDGIMAVFSKLAEAEGKAHGQDPEQVHFHELGSADTVVDVTAAVAGLTSLGIEKVLVSPVNAGAGSIRTTHGVFPVPTPATVYLASGFDVFSDGEQGEKTTPTGAAILAAFGKRADGMPIMTVEKTGYGAGRTDFKRSVNVLQAILGKPSTGTSIEQSAIIECNIDDMNPQIYPYLIQKLLEQGAQDAFITPVIMKKGRPGCLLTVVASDENSASLRRLLLEESSTIGLRQWSVMRYKADREIRELETPWGNVRIKIASIGENRRAVPEFEDCRKAAEVSGRPLLETLSIIGGMAAAQLAEDDQQEK